MSGLSKVLIVDDEMLIRQGIINYIDWEEEGFEIAGEASNGQEALSFMENCQPNIVITDIVMPDMDGIELVRTVKKLYPAIEIVVLSSFEDFEYVRTTFQNGVADYILKPKLNGKDLTAILRRIAPYPNENTSKVKSRPTIEEGLSKLISGISLTREEGSLVKEMPYNHYYLIAVCGYKKELDYYSEISQAWGEQISKIKCMFIPSKVSYTTIVLLNFNEGDRASVIKEFNVLAEMYREWDSHWLMSSSFSTIHQLPNVYEKSLLKIKESLFYLSEERVLIDGELPPIKENNSFDLSRFLERMRQKKFETAFQSLNEHVRFLTCNYNQDVFEFKSWLENIIFNVIVLLGNMGFDVDELEDKKYEYFVDINEARYAKEAIDCFNDFLEAVQNILLIENHQSCPDDMQRLLQYIEDHYPETLSLSTLAEYFHFNSSYLSSYFSNHLKIGFSDYLNQVRITKAKQMLVTSSASIGQISAKVGYSESSYFCKVFKRHEGISPGSYRKKVPAMN